MALPFALTTLPKGALDVIRYLAQQDSYAAYDGSIIDATGLSDRAFGKVIRRLVTKEYVEMQIDGSYCLTDLGTESAEIIIANDEEAQTEASFDAPDTESDLAEVPAVARKAMIVHPSEFAAGQPGYLFVRVDEATAGNTADLPVDVLVRVTGGGDIFPEQGDTTIPQQTPADPVRFEVTLPDAGDITLQVEVLQITQTDLLNAGKKQITVSAGTGRATFKLTEFDLILQPGL
jgi:predicted transcriptional regulator